MAEVKGGQQPQQQGKAPASAPVAETKLYTVKGPGSVTLGGEIYTVGAELQLTEEDAKSLGGSVMVGKAKPADVISKRKAGRYQVAPERSLWSDGQMRSTGYQIDLDEAEARALGDAVEPVL